MRLNLDPAFVNVPDYYVIKNDAWQYLKVLSSTDPTPQVGWTTLREVASQWRDAGHGNVQVVLLERSQGPGSTMVPRVTGGWCVGLEAALDLMAKYGGHLVWVRTHRRRCAKAA